MPSFRCIPTIYTLNLKYRVAVILHTLLVCTITCQFGLCLFWKSTSFQKSSYILATQATAHHQRFRPIVYTPSKNNWQFEGGPIVSWVLAAYLVASILDGGSRYCLFTLATAGATVSHTIPLNYSIGGDGVLL